MVDSKELLQKLMSGSHGITRDGKRAIYIGKELYSPEDEFPHAFLIVGSEIKNSEIEWYTEDLRYSGQSPLRLSPNDIVSLWKEKPEPFNLERALSGEPIKFMGEQTELKCWLHKSRKSDGYFIEFEDGGIDWGLSENSLNTKFEMWKEPEPVKPSADDLPKPIREFGNLETVWYINKTHRGYEPSSANKNTGWAEFQYNSLKNNCYYASKEDCKRICDWLMNR